MSLNYIGIGAIWVQRMVSLDSMVSTTLHTPISSNFSSRHTSSRRQFVGLPFRPVSAISRVKQVFSVEQLMTSLMSVAEAPDESASAVKSEIAVRPKNEVGLIFENMGDLLIVGEL